MSIVSNFAAEPNRLEMLVNFLKSVTRGYTKTELEELFSPSSGRGESSVFKEVYSVADSLGIIELEEQDSGASLVQLNHHLKKEPLISYIENQIFKQEFVLKDKFSFAAAWLLIQNPQNPIDWADNISSRVTQDLSNGEFGELELTNNSRSQHFSYWCQYLGFSSKVSISGKTHIIPDPTPAILRHLKSIFQDSKEVEIEKFLNVIVEKLPVLERGWIRDKVESVSREGLQRNENELSYSTSLALLRLEEKGIIKLLSKSDANVMRLNSAANRRISHIQYTGVKK
ncbi:protein DpdG [Sulfurovum sp.]|uniref:protein DpdG n=1 Tax=Sulfurovum sp. TaxID=1969726 RepID=UPI0035628E4D